MVHCERPTDTMMMLIGWTAFECVGVLRGTLTGDWTTCYDCALHVQSLCRLQVMHCYCLNLMYGSKLSPPRMQQCREQLDEYFEYNRAQCSWFHSCLQLILKQRYPARRITDVGVAEAICHVIAVHDDRLSFSSCLITLDILIIIRDALLIA